MREVERELFSLLSGRPKLGALPEFAKAYANTNNVFFALASKSNAFGPELKRFSALNAQRNELALKAASALKENGLDFVVMKSFFSFPFHDDDLDFVVQWEKFGECETALLKNGFGRHESRASLREPLKRFFTLDGVHFVHLHKAFSWNGVQYIKWENVLQNSESKNVAGFSFPVPSANHSLLITAAHSMFENKCIYLSDMLHLAFLSKQGKVDPSIVAGEAGELNWGPALQSFLAQANSLHAALAGKPLSFCCSTASSVLGTNLLMPHILKGTFARSFQKLFADFASLKLAQVPRQVFSYSIVDFLLYRKAVKKREKLEAMQC